MKKSMFLSTIMFLLSIVMFVGSTIAYFTDSKHTVNTFTSGNVAITMSEAVTYRDENGNLVADTTKPRVHGSEQGTVHDYGIIHPGQVICKDPLVRNIGGNDAWVAVKVTLTDGAGDLCKLMGYNVDLSDMIDIELMLNGGLLAESVHVGEWNGFDNVCHNDRYAMVQIPSRANGTYEFYFFMLSPLAKDQSFYVFDTMTIWNGWDNEDMQELRELKIDVSAYAVQTSGFSSCFEAMTAAFKSDFNLKAN